MLLYVTGPDRAAEELARRIYTAVAAQWPGAAAARRHPRTGEPLSPAITRLDLFLGAFAPAEAPAASGLSIALPPADTWWRWVPDLRQPLRDLILATFPSGPRYAESYDPVGPRLAHPTAENTERLAALAAHLPRPSDPAQPPLDPRLWLVLAPPLPPELETSFLAQCLRAEPYARVARAPGDPGQIPDWLAGEVDALAAGRGLTSSGLVTDLSGATPMPVIVSATGSSRMLDAVSGLERLYASRETLEPGEVYNRFHSHTSSEELYLVLEGEGHIRINERVQAIRAGQCFGKPCGYDLSTQLVNSGARTMVFLDIGTLVEKGAVDVGRYPEHGELMMRLGGRAWIAPLDALFPMAQIGEVYDRAYYREATPRKRPGPR